MLRTCGEMSRWLLNIFTLRKDEKNNVNWENFIWNSTHLEMFFPFKIIDRVAGLSNEKKQTNWGRRRRECIRCLRIRRRDHHWIFQSSYEEKNGEGKKVDAAIEFWSKARSMALWTLTNKSFVYFHQVAQSRERKLTAVLDFLYFTPLSSLSHALL